MEERHYIEDCIGKEGRRKKKKETEKKKPRGLTRLRPDASITLAGKRSDARSPPSCAAAPAQGGGRAAMRRRGMAGRG